MGQQIGSPEMKPRLDTLLGKNQATGKVDSVVILTRITILG